MAVEGTLDLFKLPEILQLIAQQKKTGILTVQGQHDIVAISFLSGRVVAADALNQAMEEGLSRVLLSEGLLGAADLARASSEHQQSGERLIDVLVHRGYITRPRLLGALRLQTYRLVERLLHWEEGDFKFYSGEEVSYEESFVPIPVEEILLHAVQDAEEAAERRSATATASVAAPALAPPRAAGPRGLAPITPVTPVAPAAPTALPGPERRRAAPARSVSPLVLPMPPLAAGTAGPAGRAEAAGPGEMPFRHMQVEQSAVGRSHRAVARSLAALAAAVVAALLVQVPDELTLPFPWQEGQRAALARAERVPLYLKIDRAAKTFFLLEGHFPDRLSQLERSGLLSPGDLRDPLLGTPLQYAARAEGYQVQPVDAHGRPRAGAESTEAITGNFLLDPEFISVSPDSRAPLVLLD
jgi:hypothetical protein